MNITKDDLKFIQRTIDLALKSENKGNLPIGALVVLDGKVIAEGENAIFSPKFDLGAHAEIRALSKIDSELLITRGKEMTLYTNVEPCLMCFGSIVMHKIGRVVFGGIDANKGATYLKKHLCKIYLKKRVPIFVGPVCQDECGPMWDRANSIYREKLQEFIKT